MNNISSEEEFVLHGGEKLTLRIFEDRLLFLHARFMSGQYIVKETDFYLLKQPCALKLAIASIKSPEDYQSFYFKSSEYKKLTKYIYKNIYKIIHDL